MGVEVAGGDMQIECRVIDAQYIRGRGIVVTVQGEVLAGKGIGMVHPGEHPLLFL